MAISNNPFMKGVTGAIGKQVVYRIVAGKQILSAYPDMSDRELSPAQLKQNERMKKANIIVKEIMADEQKRNEAQLRLNVTRNKLHDALIREQLTKLRQLEITFSNTL